MRTFVVQAMLLVLLVSLRADADESIQFNRDVRPILSEHCWQCHGFDERTRKSGLRLDVREHATVAAESGAIAVVPHDADSSALIERVESADPETRMPPASLNKPLSKTQIETLRQWITEGAIYQRHWSFEPITKPVVPVVDGVPVTENGANPIDAFVAAQLRRHGLTFAPEASRELLLRRISLGLTGLPPTLDDLDRADESYEQAVDRLLASDHFGEHLAVDWLDTARYADTNGYFSDKPRQMWLWRNWVIDAFNSNMPFDQFTVEQLAGDLLPNPTTAQRIATGFNRNHIANNETGIIDEEYRTEYVIDQVDTTLTTWMGLTAACAQCHDHKYDPITQIEFYQLFAIFNNVPETGLIVADNPPPLITVTTPAQDQQLAALTAATTEAANAFAPLRSALDTQIAAWESDALVSLPYPPEESLLLHEAFNGQLAGDTQHIGTKLIFQPGIRNQAAGFDATQHAERVLPGFKADAPWSIGLWILPKGSLSCPLSKIAPEGNRRGLEILCQKGRIGVNLVERWGVSAIEVVTHEPMTTGQWHHLVVSYDGSRTAAGLRILIDGTPVVLDVHRNSLTGSFDTPEVLRIGRRDSGLGYYGLVDELRIVQRCLTDSEVDQWFHSEQIRGIIEKTADTRSGRDAETLLDYYIDRHAEPTVQHARELAKTTQRAAQMFRESLPTTLVMEELPEPRAAHVLQRGQYDQPGAAVEPGIPAMFTNWPDDAPRNRLGFARWLVSHDNPLTARLAVNRFWKQCFGEGLVRTMNDLGTQGDLPTHPDLLDWLAADFRDSGWNIKAMLKQIVMSRTYRQDSRFRGDVSTDTDPQNRWLARGPRFRMSAEMIRDHALAVSGLLRPQIGGPSVKPYQPPGLWEEVSYNAEETYVQDTGDGLWRRSLYTYVKRQAPPPELLAFDGPTREKCTVQRPRTNTPMQSLILLNDPTWIEAARILATSVIQTNADDGTRLTQLFRRVLSRLPDDHELSLLRDLLQRQRERFLSAPADAKMLVSVGEWKLDESIDPIELAAMTVVAHTLLNLDEAMTLR